MKIVPAFLALVLISATFLFQCCKGIRDGRKLPIFVRES